MTSRMTRELAVVRASCILVGKGREKGWSEKGVGRRGEENG